jgi:D-alanyl-D-alanine carboxypeptidase/D-alanyl-D-alanine-endopeptidase (penicillin-binding protein 4)
MRRCWLGFVALLALAAPAWSQPLPPAVVTALRAAGVPESAIGVVVMEPGGRTLLAHNADGAMNPASVMKLVTTTAALDLLGPAYTWRTEMHVQGRLESSGQLEGDLVLKGGGDPRFTLENFWMLLRDVRARGVRDVTGDLVVDRTLFAAPEIDPASFDGEPTRPYNVGPDAALVNFKATRLTFVPDAQARAVRIYAEPPLPDLNIVNNLGVTDGPCDAWPERPEADFATSTLVFNGAYPLACGEKSKHFSLLPPLEYTRALFDHLWRGLGGSFSGRVREGTVPAGSQPLASIESATLLELVRDINKNSNNVMARQLYLGLSTGSGTPATPEQSRAVIDQWLRSRSLSMPELVIENGAGLSRAERIAPRNLARLLATTWQSPYGPELASSLPIAGVDGTLKRRFNNGSPVVGRAHLKTGYLENVRAIAGYVHGDGGRTLVVVSLVNHANARNAPAVQEAVVEWALAAAASRSCCGRRKLANLPRQASGRIL